MHISDSTSEVLQFDKSLRPVQIWPALINPGKMPLLSLNAKLDRTDQSTSWGFRLHGGQDFGSPLTIQRVGVLDLEWSVSLSGISAGHEVI